MYKCQQVIAQFAGTLDGQKVLLVLLQSPGITEVLEDNEKFYCIVKGMPWGIYLN